MLRTHGFNPYQHVFGCDPDLALDILLLGAYVDSVTMPVLDCPGERVIQIRQAARQPFVERQDDKVMRRALEARPSLESEFRVEDQVAFWRKENGRGMRPGQSRLAWESSCAGAVSRIKERVDRISLQIAQGVASTATDGNNHGEGG